jgi:hypothetical protein
MKQVNPEIMGANSQAGKHARRRCNKVFTRGRSVKDSKFLDLLHSSILST